MKIYTTCEKCERVAKETYLSIDPRIAYETYCHNCAHGIVQYIEGAVK